MIDEEIILKHDQSVRPRARMEVKIVNQLIKSAEQFHYTFKIEDGEQDNIKEELFNLDDAYLLVYDATDREFAWIRLVFGNNGYDLISDYTTNLEDFLTETNKLAERLENGLE